MKPISVSGVITLVFAFFCCTFSEAQTITSSAVWISDCNQSNYFNTSGLIGPVGNVFTDNNFGTHTQNSHTLIFRGGEVRTSKIVGVSNVCGAKLHYSVYPQGGSPGTFNTIDLLFMEDCDLAYSQYPSGGSCVLGDQKWNMISDDGATIPYAPVDLTTFAPGNYVLEVYYDITGSSTSTTACDETITLNNGGANYKASFSIQSPALASANPTSCNGSEGFITISGLTPGATYSISYTDDGNPVGPNNMTANGSGQIIISGLNAGIYSDFNLVINGCETNLNTGLILSNPVIIPKFNKIAAFCAGTTAPILPTTSLNGINGTWNPSTIDNQTSRSYTFTPDPGQCGLPATMNVTVIQRTTPTFTQVAPICSGQTLAALPATSNNGITGSWSPAIDNTATTTYTFTPGASQCATTATMTITVNQNTTITSQPAAAATYCAGSAATALSVGATGTGTLTYQWYSNTSNSNSGGTLIGGATSSGYTPSTTNNGATPLTTYYYVVVTGDCGSATSNVSAVTVNPIITPTFTQVAPICSGQTLAALPTTSNNGITGSWSPAIDNTATTTYTFSPGASQCATTATMTITVNQNTVPTFDFGTSLVICEGSAVPSLPTTSTNGITGSWSPATVSNQASAVYTFTPDPVPGECLASAQFIVTVNQKLAPTFNFGSSLTICTGANVPVLLTTSNNGIAGTWSPSTVSNQTSGTYTFTPGVGECASSGFVLNVNVTPVSTVDFEADTTVTDGAIIPGNTLSGTPAGVSFSWANSNTAIGLGASGNGNVPSFTATNPGANTIKGIITITPTYNGCTGTAKNYTITVIPLDKDIFVPNVFTPNGDGKNDILYAYSNYISKLEMRIFNQYGQQVELITDPKKGWDGKYKGTPQPVGVYMYALKATMTDGKTIELKGNITLIR